MTDVMTANAPQEVLGDVDFLMTDDFVQFAEQIKAIKAAKEEKTDAIKQAYAAYQDEVETLDKQAKDLYDAFKAKQSPAQQ